MASILRSPSYSAALDSPLDEQAPVHPAPGLVREERKLEENKTQDKDASVYGRAMENASILSLWLFFWVSPVVARARCTAVQLRDLYFLPRSMEPANVLERFKVVWKIELQKKGNENASIGLSLCKTFKWEICRFLIIVTFMTAFMLLGPVYFVPRLIDYAGSSSPLVWQGVLFALGLTLSEAIRSLTVHQFWFLSTVMAINCRTIVFALVYDRAISLRTLCGYSIGELVNICTNDGQRIFDAAAYAAFVYISVITAIGVLAYTVTIVGPAAIAGWFILLLMLPFQAMVAKFTGKLRRKAIRLTDRRVRIMNEILTCVKLIKMYAWEDSFAAQIAEIRRNERRHLVHAGYLQSITVSLVPLIPVFAGVATFVIAAYTGHSFSSSDAFSVMSAFNAFRFSLTVLPMFVKSASEAKVGMKRLRHFVTLEDRPVAFPAPVDPAMAVVFDHATLSWTKLSDTFKDGSRASMGNCANEALRDISLAVPRGTCVGICGSVGSGKSSLLSALLAQLELRKGTISISGSLCFVAQQAWIQSDTLRNNILFGQPFNPERYEMVLEACSLKYDLDILPAGDLTEIGERGINLSGGQKQRISLARAVYSDKDIYLLDDPLSAVDSHVGRHIFERCIRGLLSKKTVLFVTHQLQYLPYCDHAVFMADGAIVGQGSAASLCESVPQFKTQFLTFGTSAHGSKEQPQKQECKDISVAEAKPLTVKDVCAGKSLVKVEDRETGCVTCKTYLAYARAGGGCMLYLLVLALFLASAAAKVFSDWWLSYWVMQVRCCAARLTVQGSGDPRLPSSNPGSVADNDKLSFYAIVYGLSAIVILVLQAFRGYLFVWLTLSSSSNLHNQVFRKMLSAPMDFFDTTPTGRILNRFSKDLDEIDVQLPSTGEQFLQNTATILVSIGLVAYVLPYFLIALFPICVFFSYVVWYFWPCQREVKRVDNITRSPLVSHLSATLQGLSTIHAFNKGQEFIELFFQLLDSNTRAFFGFFYTSRWFALRLDWTTTMMTAAVSFLVVGMAGSVNPALCGLCLMYVNFLGGLFQYSTRLSAELEARMTSVERIHYYASQVNVEAAFVTPQDPPTGAWPKAGEITFENFSIRYRESLPLVLKNVSFNIKAKEKIGIVGRTGSGKSSVCLALFRLMEASEGRILIDGLDISTIGLKALRSALSIIPQDPIMFVGTLRYNLDPFSQHTDAELWQAIDQAHLRSTIESLPQQLMSPIVENGENLSLVCMARALLRRSCILVLDEATAAVDAQTDAAIQSTIRHAFGNCTILTVAHRLNTILDYDRILVLDDGHVAEFDSPANLLIDPASRFSKMVQAVNRTNQAGTADTAA